MPLVDINGAVVEFPDDMSEDQLNQAVSAAAGQVQPQKRGMMGKAWDALGWPERTSREGLNMIAGSIPKNIGSPTGEPTGNMARDLVAGAPRIVADTMAEAAPGFVSRGSIVTGGLLKAMKGVRPLMSLGRQAAFGQAERISGIAPTAEGALEATYQAPGTMVAPGKKAVSKIYEGVKNMIRPLDQAKLAQTVGQEQQAQNTANLAATRAFLEGKAASPTAEKLPSVVEKLDKLKNESASLRYIKRAAELAKEGKLPAEQALEARKMTDALKGSKSLNPQWVQDQRVLFDGVWKGAAGAGPDAAYKTAVNAEMLRNITPQNLRGGASTMKMGVATALKGMGVPGNVILALMSPAAQGAGAAAMGGATRQALNPLLKSPMMGGSGLQAIVEALHRRRESNAKR